MPTNWALATNGGRARRRYNPAYPWELINYPPGAAIDGNRMNLPYDFMAGYFSDIFEVTLRDSNGNGVQRSISEINIIMLQDEFNTPSLPTLSMTGFYNVIGSFNLIHYNFNTDATVPVTGNNKVWRQFLFDPPILVYGILMECLAPFNPGQENPFIVEIEAWDTSGPPPATPTGLAASSITTTSVNLSWNAAATATGYRLFRNETQIVDTASTSYGDTGLTPQTTYRYTVAAYNANGASAPAAQVVVSTSIVGAPSEPGTLTIDTSDPPSDNGLPMNSYRVKMYWGAATDNVAVTGYKIWRNEALIQRTVGGGLSFTDRPTQQDGSGTGLLPGTAYSYQVSAYDANEYDGQMSNAVAVTSFALPTMLTDVAASEITQTSLRLSWTASTVDSRSGPASYRIYRLPQWVVGPSFWVLQEVASGVTTYVDDGKGENLIPGATYSYQVVAEDDRGDSSLFPTPLLVTTESVTDTEAPTVPTFLLEGSKTDTTAQLTWTASTDNVGVTGYKVFRNGAQVSIYLLLESGDHILLETGDDIMNEFGSSGSSASALASPFTDTGLVPLTAYTYNVSAFDGAGNDSGYVGQTARVITTNATSPSAPTAPTNLNAPFVSGSSSHRAGDTLYWSPSSVTAEGATISTYRVWVDNVLFTGGALTIGDPCFRTLVIQQGTHSYQVSAVDSNG